MNYAKNLLSSLLLCFVIGCAGTVAPSAPKDSAPSFDGNAQNSGFLGFDAAGSGILTAHSKDRYDALVSLYGARFVPPVKVGDGVSATATNTYLIDRQHLVYFATMNRWKKEGK